MDIESLIRLQLELECIRINQRGYLQAFPCDNPDAPARLAVMYDGENYYRYIRHDVPAEMRQLLKLIANNTVFSAHDRVKNVLLEDTPCHEMFIGKTYIFPENTPFHEDKQIMFEDTASRCLIMVDGEVASACSSVRENGQAAEAWVFTHDDHRRKGYGLRVVKAWANRIRKAGKIPFYSHAVTNIGSQRLAQSAGMQWVFDIVAYK